MATRQLKSGLPSGIANGNVRESLVDVVVAMQCKADLLEMACCRFPSLGRDGAPRPVVWPAARAVSQPIRRASKGSDRLRVWPRATRIRGALVRGRPRPHARASSPSSVGLIRPMKSSMAVLSAPGASFISRCNWRESAGGIDADPDPANVVPDIGPAVRGPGRGSSQHFAGRASEQRGRRHGDSHRSLAGGCQGFGEFPAGDAL